MPSELPALHVLGVRGLPEVRQGDDLVALAVEAVRHAAIEISAGDIFVFTQKIVSKAEGRVVRLDTVQPSPRAREWAAASSRDPRVIELVLGESARIVRMERAVLIAETRHGFVCANAGVDTSNVPVGWASLLPLDPDESARRLAARLRAAFDCAVGVIVSDTFGRPWREGQTNVAIGVAGFRPIVDYRGVVDSHGHRLRMTAIAIADELASAAEVVMGKTGGVPVAVVKGARLEMADAAEGASARALVRKPDEDLFR